MLRLLAVGAFLFAASALHAAQAEIVGIPKIYLRAGPSADEPPLAILSAGDVVDVVDIEGSWTKVHTTDGKIGYIYHRYVTPKLATEAGAARESPPTTMPSAEAAHPDSFPAASAAAESVVRSTAPLEAPATVAAPEAPAGDLGAAPSAERSPSEELSVQVASLRAEIADLKEKVQNRQAQLAAEPGAAAVPSATDGLATPPGTATTPAAPISGRDQAVGVLMIAAFSLVIGWVLGSTFGRRGSRSRGSRLRF
jgi:uncharacterized protein YgiM (DUF1202 family)